MKCPRPFELLVTKEGQDVTSQEQARYEFITKQNGIRWVDCAKKVVNHIKEEKECLD